MSSTCCALGIAGDYRDRQILLAPGEISRPFRRLCRKEKIMLNLFCGRMNSEFVPVV